MGTSKSSGIKPTVVIQTDKSGKFLDYSIYSTLKGALEANTCNDSYFVVSRNIRENGKHVEAGGVVNVTFMSKEIIKGVNTKKTATKAQG